MSPFAPEGFFPLADIEHIRRSSSATMTDLITLIRPLPTTAYDAETGTETRGEEVLYDGICSVSYPESKDSIDRLFGGNPSVAPTANATIRIPPADDDGVEDMTNYALAKMIGQAEELSGEVSFRSKIGTGWITMSVDMVYQIRHGHTRNLMLVKLGFPAQDNEPLTT